MESVHLLRHYNHLPTRLTSEVLTVVVQVSGAAAAGAMVALEVLVIDGLLGSLVEV